MNPALSVILGVLCFVLSGASCCNVDSVNSCMLLLNSGADGGSLKEGIAAIPTPEQLKNMCSNISEFKACYEPEAALCQTDVIFSMTFGTIEKTINYLCTEGYADILRHSACWSQSRVKEDIAMCHLQQDQMLKSLQDFAASLNSTDLRAVWCQILDNTTSCMTNAVSGTCDSEARCIMGTMMSRSLAGLADFMQCPNATTTCSTTANPAQTPIGGSTSNTGSPTTVRTETVDRGETGDQGKPGSQRSTGTPLADRWVQLTLLSLVSLIHIVSML